MIESILIGPVHQITKGLSFSEDRAKPALKMSSSGILYVTAQVQTGPEREQSKTNTNILLFTKYSEYQATDNKEPAWLEIHEYSDTSKLPAQNQYLDKAESLSNSSSDGTLYYFVSSRQSPTVIINSLRPGGVELVAVTMMLQDVENAEAQLDRWYEEEHIGLLSKVPGWLRTRRFRTSSSAVVAGNNEITYLALHEYRTTNGLGGMEHRAAMTTRWRDDIINMYAKTKSRRTYQLRRVEGH